MVSIIRANGSHDLSLQSFMKIMFSPGPAQDIARIAGGLSSPTMNRKNKPFVEESVYEVERVVRY